MLNVATISHNSHKNHLFQECSFYRAYQMSAWLCVRYLHEFKVNNHRFKSIEEVVTFIGFPAQSLQKWIPEDVGLQVVEDKHFLLNFSSKILSDSSTTEGMLDEYKAWKEQLPVEESSAQRKDSSPSERHTSG